ncbi:Ig-like domain-containing protein [Salmonella enterica]|uniref:Phage tail protein n=1 Tax=Salmonella enterica subsp. enterica serovar Ank TaxID=1173578 RepID=A0A5I2WXS4_SALET|nr:phage tail protein [Salmonella enterica subsp. enterica serovar Pomona]ECF3882217.1 phage tail protein [Salmonella enterica subsp. enterica serovar Ank]EEJ1799882.1 phage tail protein [Salmonella enterica subsp. enterica serovar Pomona]EJM3644399.1 Ig-like domain-containing protein [Salmonella enterica]HAE1795937.1 phage tail protein [Salmonella enterica subsp. enterica serovar Ank]
MGAPNPLKKVKGAGTTFWLYTGNGDAYANPLGDNDWLRMAMVKDLQPGEMTADSEDDNYLDDEDADWDVTAQGQKSAGDTSITLAWKPGEAAQKKLVELFDSGDVQAWRIKYPNGTVDVFKGWVSGLGKAIQSKEFITRTLKIKGVGRPHMAEEDTAAPVNVTGLTVVPVTANVSIGATIDLTFTVVPDNAADKSLRVASSDTTLATVSVSDNVATIKGVKAGAVKIIGMTTDGNLTALADITVR